MKKLIVSLILLASILISSFAFAITGEEATKYLDKDVFIVKAGGPAPIGLYGRIVDIIYVDEELYIVLDTYYRIRQLMFFRVKSIVYIRERKKYE